MRRSLPPHCGPIVVGTAALGSPLPEALVGARPREHGYRLLDGFLELGLTAFDLAASYMVGGTERLVGGWMASRHNRDQLYLISKGGHPLPVVAPHRLGRAALTADLHASLGRLRTDRIDLYLLHRDDESEPLEALLETLMGFRQKGLIGAWGVSNWTHPRIEALERLTSDGAAEPMAASSPQLSLVDWTRPPFPGCVSIAGEGGRAARQLHRRAGLPVLAWSPLGGGYFAVPGPTARSRRVYDRPDNRARRERAAELGRKYGVPAAAIALAYVLSQPFPVHAVIAASTAVGMKRNVDSSALRLAESELSWLESGAA